MKVVEDIGGFGDFERDPHLTEHVVLREAEDRCQRTAYHT